MHSRSGICRTNGTGQTETELSACARGAREPHRSHAYDRAD